MYDDKIVPSVLDRGTPLYKVNGSGRELETVTFIQKQIVDGATMPTYTVRKSDRTRALVSVDFYHRTKQLAWTEAILDAQSGIASAEQGLLDRQERIKAERHRLAFLRQSIDQQIRADEQ